MNNIDFLKNAVDYGIFGLLSLMGFLIIFIYIERLLFFSSIKLENYKSIKSIEIEITNNITIISTIGANAVYIGLLGTVLGIIITFYNMGLNGNIDVKIIMSSLALALKATAFGLVIAIPSMIFYNHITRKIEVIINKWYILNES